MSSNAEETPRQSLGAEVPDFTLPAIRGGSVSLGEIVEGRRGALVVFWSGICSHCERYDEWLDTFEERHPELALAVVASREGETEDEIRRAAAKRGLGFEILRDADRAVARAFEVQQTPKVFLIDAQRRLYYRGAIDNFKYPEDPDHEPHLAEAIDAFLAGREIRRPETPSFGCPVSSVYYRIPKPLES